MIALVANLQTKDPFYVRCIKPNEIKSPMRFDDERCLHQVRLKCAIVVECSVLIRNISWGISRVTHTLAELAICYCVLHFGYWTLD